MLKHEICKEAANIAVIGATGYTGVELIRLLLSHPKFRIALKKKGLLTRDSRVVERKKYGRKKARKSFQFSKR